MIRFCNWVPKSENSLVNWSKRIWKPLRNQDCLGSSESVKTCYASLLFSLRSTTEFFFRRFNVHLDPMVTLCPHRAKNCFIWVGKSHSIGVFVRGGCPVPPSPSYHNGDLWIKCCLDTQTCRIASASFCFENSVQTTKPQAVRDPRPVKDSGWALSTARDLRPGDPGPRCLVRTNLACVSLNRLVCLWYDCRWCDSQWCHCSIRLILKHVLKTVL